MFCDAHATLIQTASQAIDAKAIPFMGSHPGCAIWLIDPAA
jgi:hypothetical protein